LNNNHFIVDLSYVLARSTARIASILADAEDKLKIELKVKNILNGKYQEVIGVSVQKEFYKGTEFKVDFSYS